MSAEFKWYVAHTYSGYENKVKDSIEKTVENRGLGELIGDVCIPVEEAVEENDKGEKKTVTYFNRTYASDDVVKLAIQDMERGRDVSILGLPVRNQVRMVKLLPHKLIMSIWMKQQGLK